MEPKNVITATGLTAGYKEKTVWKDANFSIGQGEFVAVLGPNGAGKTTLFRLLLGLQRPLSGEVMILGEKPKRGNPRIGYVPQKHPLDNEMNIEAVELVRLGISGGDWGPQFSSRDEYAKAREALKIVGGEYLAREPLGSLSGGELQRVFLAEALVSEPDLLLLDEPLASLDIRRQGELVQLIAGITKARSITALLIAHDINPLLSVLDKVVYVANGKTAVGKPEEVLTSEFLSSLYETPVEVFKNAEGRVAVLGIEEIGHIHTPEHQL